MSQITFTQTHDIETTATDWNRLCRLGGVAAWIQLACLLFTLISFTLLGVQAEPTTAEKYYTMLQNDGLTRLLQLDFATLILICLFPFVAVAIYAAFRSSKQAYALLAMVLILVGTLLGLANHHAFSMMRLSDLHAAAATTAQQEQLLAAGEAVLAANLWNSTAGFIAGVFMQGGFIFISFVMLGSKGFSKGTAYTGILSNGLDLVHLFVALFMPVLGTTLLAIGGIFYLIWFPLLGWDLYRLGRSSS